MEQSKEITIDGITTTVSEQQLEEIKKMIINKSYRKELREKYFFLKEQGVDWSREVNDKIDERRHKNGNYFDTEEEAQMIYDFQMLNRKLHLFSKRNGEHIDWDNSNERKIYISINNKNKTISLSTLYETSGVWEVFFSSKEIAKKAIIENKELFEKVYKGYEFNL